MIDLTIDELLDPDPSVEISDDLENSAVLADWLGLSSSRINQLARDGVFQRDYHNGQYAFPLKASVQAYAEHLRNRSVRSSDQPTLRMTVQQTVRWTLPPAASLTDRPLGRPTVSPTD